MPSALAAPLFDRLIDAFPPDRAYPPAAFEGEPMPPPVAHFLARLLERRLRYEAERLELPRSPWFDAGHAGVHRARGALVDALAQQGHFPPEAWEASLQQAVEQVAAYLVRPAAALEAFVFQDAAAVPAADVERRLGYFSGYGYLHETVRMYFQQKNVDEIDPARFAELLRHIDRRMTRDYDAEAWLRLLAPLFDLARRALPGSEDGVPVWLLRAFFDDKDAGAVTQRLQAAQERQGVEALDEAGLRRLLEKPDPPAAAPEADRAAKPPLTAPPPDETPQGHVPLWKQFQRGNAPAAQRQAAPARARAPEEPPRPSPAREALPRWMQFRPDAAPATPAPTTKPTPAAPTATDLAGVEQAVLGDTGARNRDLFVKHLFEGAAADYERVLRRIETAPSWAEASQIIAEEVFRKNQVNIYSDPAVLFTDAVEARYA